MDALEHLHNAPAGVFSKWFNKNEIAVVVVYNHDVIVAFARRDEELSHLIQMDLPHRLDDSSKAIIAGLINWLRGVIPEHQSVIIVVWNDLGMLGGL